MLFLKQNLGPDFYLKPNERCKTVPTHPDVLPKPHPCGPHTAPEYYSHLSVPYLLSMTFLHKDSISNPYHHKLLPSKAWLKLSNFLTPNPPCLIGLHTLENQSNGHYALHEAPPPPQEVPQKSSPIYWLHWLELGKERK